MIPETSVITDITFQRLLVFVLWPLLVGGIIYLLWKKKPRSAGVVATYLTAFTSGHWAQAVVYALPWYDNLGSDPVHVWVGFSYATLGLVALGFGAVVVHPFLREFHHRLMDRHLTFKSQKSEGLRPDWLDPKTNEFLPLIYFPVGILSILVLPLFGNVASVSAYISAIAALYTVGLILGYLKLFKGMAQPFVLAALITLTIFWPLYTIGAQGFLGYTLLSLQFVALCVFWQSPKLLRVLPVIAIVLYIGLSFSVSYMLVRSDIRAVAWNETTSASEQVRESSAILRRNLITFDPFNNKHLRVIDIRLNQNELVGRTVQRIESRQVELANGKTILNAVFMIIPRVIWPDKPVALGGQEIVNKYSGFSLLAGSVQPGQVMEFYLNFGRLGVILGFVVYGFVLAWFDERAGYHLSNRSYSGFAIWAVASYGMFQSSNSLIAVVGATVSGGLAVASFHYGLKVALTIGRRYAHRSQTPAEGTYHVA